MKKYAIDFDPYSGSEDSESAGNGSIMRLAPVPMLYGKRPLFDVAEICGLSSSTTHAATTTVDACRFLGVLIAKALNGTTKDEILKTSASDEAFHELGLCVEIADVANGSYRKKSPPEIIGTGYVVKSLEAALWAFYRSGTFEEGCLVAANLGNDADTTAAVYG